MKAKILVVGTMFLVFGIPSVVYAQFSLLEIRPMISRKEDILRMVKAVPEQIGKDELFFRLKDGNLSVIYSTGNCSRSSAGSWNVPKDTVLFAAFYPVEGKMSPKKFNLVKAGTIQSWNHGHRTFSNREKGIFFTTQRKKLSLVHISPASEYENLRCAENKSPQ